MWAMQCFFSLPLRGRCAFPRPTCSSHPQCIQGKEGPPGQLPFLSCMCSTTSPTGSLFPPGLWETVWLARARLFRDPPDRKGKTREINHDTIRAIHVSSGLSP